MTQIRTKKEIEIMRAGGALLSRALKKAVEAVHPGEPVKIIDSVAEKVLLEGGGRPSFKGYKSCFKDKPFPSSLCISINDEVVHGLGTREVVLNDGDIVGLDIGAWYKGMCTDMAVTVQVGAVSADAARLLQTTRAAMFAGLEAVCADAPVSDVGQSIESFVRPFGFGIVRDLVGHGVGKDVHEEPHIPNFYDKRYDQIKFKAGMTIAVEPMLTAGDWRIKTLDDGWTVVTVDGSLSAHFEVTVLVTEKGYELITPLVL